jgi:predicted MFS family arabinose efflux permease
MPLVFAAGLLGIAFAPSYELAIGATFLAGIGTGGFQSLNAAVIVRATLAVLSIVVCAIAATIAALLRRT